MSQTIVLWTLFSTLIILCLAIDLGLGSKRHGRMPIKAAAIWSGVWITLAMIFAAVIWQYPPAGANGAQMSVLFITGYLVEKALSVDNMFVFIMIFAYFAVADEDQPRVLKWGIIGALVFRALLISAASLLSRFEWVLYLFALLLLWAAWKMLQHGDEEIHPERNPVLNGIKKIVPIVNRYDGHHFFTHENGKLVGTALLVVLVIVESTDIVFALDSIPAIFAITQPEVHAGRLTKEHEFFIVFTSNVFAILGLRALFFVLAGIMGMFRFLKAGVALILLFIALKMLTHKLFHLSPGQSLAIIGGILTVSILASVLIPAPPETEKKEKKEKKEGPAAPPGPAAPTPVVPPAPAPTVNP